MDDLGIDKLQVSYGEKEGILIVNIQSKAMNGKQAKNFTDDLSKRIGEKKNKNVVLNLRSLEKGNALGNDSAAYLLFNSAINILRIIMESYDVKIVMISGEPEKWPDFDVFSNEKEALESFENSHARV